MSTLISEHRLVIREYATPDGTQIKLSIEGDSDYSDEEDPEAEAPLGFVVAATLFQLYADGTLLNAMERAFKFDPKGVEIKLEHEENG